MKSEENTNEFEDVPAREYDCALEHPSPEQLLMKLAIENLTAKQKELWDMYAYQLMTQEDIATELAITQQTVQGRLKAIEIKINKYCRQNKGAYMLLKMYDKINKGE